MCERFSLELQGVAHRFRQAREGLDLMEGRHAVDRAVEARGDVRVCTVAGVCTSVSVPSNTKGVVADLR